MDEKGGTITKEGGTNTKGEGTITRGEESVASTAIVSCRLENKSNHHNNFLSEQHTHFFPFVSSSNIKLAAVLSMTRSIFELFTHDSLCFCYCGLFLFPFIVAVPSTSSLINYPVTPLSSAGFSLTAPIAPISITPILWNLLHLAPDVLPSSIASVDTPSHGHLSRHICDFLANRKHGTRSEVGLASRDDSLLDIICLLSGIEAEPNTISISTQKMTRSDVWLALPGKPPLIHVEEKAKSGHLELAQAELNKKFCPLPHYLPQLAFIIGIAIAGDLISFGKLALSGAGFEQLSPTFNLVHIEQRIRSERQFVHRSLRWMTNRDFHSFSFSLILFALMCTCVFCFQLRASCCECGTLGSLCHRLPIAVSYRVPHRSKAGGRAA